MITFTPLYTYCAGPQAALAHPSSPSSTRIPTRILTLGETVGTPGEQAPTAVGTMHGLVCQKPQPDADSLADAAERTIDQLHAQGDEGAESATVVTACGTDDELLVGHAGDCRAYLFNPYAHRLLFRSTDHSAVQEAVKAGILTPEEARTNPHRHRLTSCLTGCCRTACFTVDRLKVATGDRLLLCTPALSYALTDADLCTMVVEQPLPDAFAQLRQLCQERALHRAAFMLCGIDQPNTAAERWENKAFLGNMTARWSWQ